MPKSKTKETYTKRKKQLLRYDLELLSKQVLIEISITIEDSRNNITTPVTPLYEARFEPFSKTVKRDFEPRNLDCCFVSNDAEVHRTVYIPYLPGNAEHKAQTIEVLNYAGVSSLTYKGETHKDSYENYA